MNRTLIYALALDNGRAILAAEHHQLQTQAGLKTVSEIMAACSARFHCPESYILTDHDQGEALYGHVLTIKPVGEQFLLI